MEIDYKEKLKLKANNLPLVPGVYIMKDADKKIIYIGKAKILKNRVSQYFQSSNNQTEKVKKMISNIRDFEYIITDSEFEALILECNLIKYHKPKYNILLKDSKGYSYIKITNENWPKIVAIKQKIDDGAKYFGPYINSFYVKKVVEEVNDIFKLPSCNKNFSNHSIRPCLNYYINKCCAPCFRNISNKDYVNIIKEAEFFITKDSQQILEYLNKKMNSYSEKLKFEQAAEIRDRINAIKNIKNKQKVVSTKLKEQDVIAMVNDNYNISVEVFRFNNNNLYETKNFIIDFRTENDIIKIRTEFLKRFYSITENISSNIIIDGPIEDVDLIKKWLENKSNKKIKFIFPKKGDHFKTLELCKTNAYESLIKIKNPDEINQTALKELQRILSLKSLPTYIEAYDISNLFGTDNVGGMVVFKDGIPFKSAYRKFKIKNIIGQDDYNSMREVIDRRLKHYLKNIDSFIDKSDSFNTLPNLILIDGGRNHVQAVREVLYKNEITIPTYGMVKDSSHRTRALTDNIKEIKIKDNSLLFNFITKIQNEIHRYAISYHKKLRNEKITDSVLLKIKTIGRSKANMLLKHFKNIKNISSATYEQLLMIPSINTVNAKFIVDFFKNHVL